MSDRDEFEKRNPVPLGAEWNERLSGYYCGSSPSVEHPFNDLWECFCDGLEAAREQGGEAVAPFVLGNSYQTLAGEWVRFVKAHNEGSSYETMEDESGVNRYTNRPGDMGRVTASPVDYPGNVPPLYTHHSASVPEAKEIIDRVVAELEVGFVACERCGDQEDTATLDCMGDLRKLQTLLTATPQPVDKP